MQVMNTSFKGYATAAKGTPFKLIEFNPGDLRDEQVEIAVEYCGVCHSDLSVAENEWGNTTYPFVPGHEVVGRVVIAGSKVKGLKVDQRVGLGWFSESCMACPQCLSGSHNLCSTPEETMMRRHGGFANRVRCHWAWAVPVPDALDARKVGPLFCGGITVFNPIIQCGVQPTDRVGVIGIGGLGHMALQFLNKWGCEVTAFTSTDAKRDEALGFGAHHVVSSRDANKLQQIAGSLDFILCTANVTLPWDAIIAALAPKGRLHIVGAVLEPIPVAVFPLLIGQKAISASPLGSPYNCGRMLDFAARHRIAPQIELFPMSRVNDAVEHLRAGKARYRVVLQNDI
jgi:uncharacterized zinc-type alcohol dehydrogenase-like protein